ncbi:MAG: hypothetical protein LBH69_02370 [Methanomassiliicoccaceae archaeon]|jgi:uncharacterized membrane protein|nr:hypothetical protein [Methanomassiliicoccaceae archaeon]
MVERPRSVVLASLLALLGAFFALVIAVLGIGMEEGVLSKMAFCLLTLALFLAVAGSLNANGQWTWRFLIFAQALCAAIPMVGCVYGAIDIASCLLLVIIAVVIIFLTSSAQTKRWVEADRV